ncbi:puromycin-sensitive aminopeptidase-like protein [Tieghemostelium lacteum]|uniref:Aminopeptidase n=1 Tax=Tieghemostelium lacteum TaxID=361077 RepID=A0A151Z7Y7_TIELA|nr:puromycin-sensitive aminopeptidase-like protein [Tieghemostelium lacteum]|eukprot:KYQ90079.1 puromycin-sensitive aminopeptidase-like protein [Tieghemostelium lacteum]
MDNKYLILKGDRLVLPDQVIPSQYNLHLSPSLKDFTFNGTVDISVKVARETQIIIIHAIELKISLAKIGDLVASKISFYEPEEVAILEFDQSVMPIENTTLTLEFQGILNDQMRGFYRSKYTLNGEDRYMGSTQFEPTDARRSFPCFDEPALKAVFNVKLTIPSNLTALSNMPELSILENTNSTKTYTFDKTPKMSTYLLAYCFGEFTYIEGHTKDGVRVRIYKTAGQEESGEFALDVSIKSLNYYCNYFEISYPLTKCDQIAVPDFNLGAMENWGLITYREDMLLTSPQTNTNQRSEIAEVIAHELAHQWFGNLVTMDWWDSLYLNEGFATWVGCMATNHIFPEWNYWLKFTSTYLNSALSLDALDNSHPIEVPVFNSNQINEIFDTISYDKGSCIIRMMDGRFGESFRKGLVQYLKKHQYKNTRSDDLWDSISQVSGIDAKSFIDNFIKKTGYPVISFKATSSPGTFELTQKKFTYHQATTQTETQNTEQRSGSSSPGSTSSNSDNQGLWNCFIKIQTDQSTHEVMLDKKQCLVKIPNFNPITNPQAWIKPNFGQTGYYRIDYDPIIIKGLIPRIRSLELPATDRLGLINDSYHLCKAGLSSIGSYMELVGAYVNEKEASIWSVIVKHLSFIKELSHDEPYYPQLAQFITKLLKPISTRLKFDPVLGESSSDSMLREIINIELGSLGDTEVIMESKKRFQSFVEDTSSLHSDITSTVLNTVLLNGGELEQNELISQYLVSNNTSLKLNVQTAISKVSTPKLLEKALDFSLSKNVRAQDTFVSWYSIPSQLKPYALDYFQKHFKEIYAVHQSSSLFHHIVSSVLPIKLNQIQLDQIELFFSENPIANCERTIRQDIERIKINSIWFQQIGKDLLKWFDSQKKE